jgi:hypothetical protein
MVGIPSAFGPMGEDAPSTEPWHKKHNVLLAAAAFIIGGFLGSKYK